ncbi:alpha/beta hydrolase [Paraburkholderia caballeronis]|uniref:alpha/beta hydrolase n=1 Tax=Paraburkholderia caballeronis TaxID=416943 RepID=UPI0010647FC0|nr:alpha/beta fold hydrolase [Paraburkholderia caballeronis]TDV11663.1 acetyl esterase/lipase [Paraburkholderia caballeronis]TDV14744.1 acetyl esterase/lipase [Paraburkholderia caballeronis]TDV23864.1 acetyl esterase/lipase [Paraburkholderia caballeronis]
MVNAAKVAREPFGSLPEAQRRLLLELGPRWNDDIVGHRKIVIDCYTPLVAAAPRNEAGVRRDLAYGASPRQTLDLFEPADGVADAADAGARADGLRDAVLFVHGGAFVRGSKSVNGEIYDNVCHWFANQGVVALNVEYRLADEAPYPGGAEDVADAIAYVRSHAQAWRIDPSRIFLIGHSAGGAHAAACLFDPALATRVAQSDIAGLVLISARLFADVDPRNPNAGPVRAYFGDDGALYAARSPLTHAARSDVPLLIAVAEFENRFLDRYGAQFFVDVLRHRGVPPRFIQMRGHNHTSIVAHFNSGEAYLGGEILRFMASVAR